MTAENVNLYVLGGDKLDVVSVPDVEFTSGSRTPLRDVIWIKYISTNVHFTTDSCIPITDVVQMYCDSSTSYQLYSAL